MSSSTSTDINYVSCSDNQWGVNEGSLNPTTRGPVQDGEVLTPPTPLAYASILKLCDNSIVSLEGITVGQGSEGSVDINNHTNVSLDGTFGDSVNSGNQIFSIKGESVAVISGVLKGAGNRMGADVIVSQWSDQAYGSSSVDLTNTKHETGRKIIVVKRYGASNIVLGNNAKIAVLWSLGMTIYWWWKFLIRKVKGIKVGEKGS